MTIGKTLGDLEILPKAEEAGAGPRKVGGPDHQPAAGELPAGASGRTAHDVAPPRASPDPLRGTDRYRLVTPYPAKI